MFSELNVIRGAFRLGFLRVGADNRAWRGAEPIELPKKSSSIQIVTTWTVPLKFYMLQSSNVDQSSESLHSDKKRPQSGAAFFPCCPLVLPPCITPPGRHLGIWTWQHRLEANRRRRRRRRRFSIVAAAWWFYQLAFTAAVRHFNTNFHILSVLVSSNLPVPLPNWNWLLNFRFISTFFDRLPAEAISLLWH